MSSQITSVRLPRETQSKLIALARSKGKTKSDIIKESLDLYYEREEDQINSYAIGLPYFGKYSLGEGDLSTTYKERIREKLRARQNSY